MKIRTLAAMTMSAVLLAAVVGVWLYLSDYYRADKTAVAALQDTAPEIELRQSDTRIDFIPRAPQAGLIFYPGGKVSFEAYAPLMQACAERGILCVLLDMPGNLAVLDPNAADGIAASYPEIDRWYIGGHSLGGVMAARYAAKHNLQGVILLACETAGVKIYEYTPLQVKQAVVGYGRAEKAQVMDMVKRICGLSAPPRPDDAADAVALALCHARSSTSLLFKGDRDECSTI